MASKVDIADESSRIWREVANGQDRKEWIERWKKNWDFRVGQQWSDDESDDLKANGMIDYVINRIRPAFRYEKNVIMAKRPTIRLTAVRGADTYAVTEFQRLVRYFWQISKGLYQCQRMLDPYFDAGLGILMAYEDNEADYGRGELKFKEVSPDYIYIPRYARDIQFEDAKDIFYAKPITIDEALDTYGHIRGINKETLQNNQMGVAETYDSDSYYGPEQEVLKKQLDTEGVTSTEYILLLERTSKTKETRILRKVLNSETGSIDIFLTDEDTDISEYLAQRGIDAYEIQDEEETRVTRIRRTVTLGERIFVSSEILPISKHPFAFTVGEDLRNPYPVGEVHFSIGQQKMVNHLHSLITFIGQTLGIPTTIVREGIFRDKKHKSEVQKNRAIPGYIWEVHNIPEGRPLSDSIMIGQPAQPPAVLSELLQFNLQQIDNNTGIFPIKMGDPSAAPRTADATARIGEWGDVAIQGPILALNNCFEQLFNIFAEWAPSYYTIEKSFEIMEGKKKIPGKVNALDSEGLMYGDIRTLEARVYVDVGSYVSVSRVSSQLLYKELASINPLFLRLFIQNDDNIDEEEKKKILEELNQLPQLQMQVEKMSEYIEETENVLTEIDKERLKAEERTHIERLRGQLKTIKATYQAQQKAESDNESQSEE